MSNLTQVCKSKNAMNHQKIEFSSSNKLDFIKNNLEELKQNTFHHNAKSKYQLIIATCYINFDFLIDFINCIIRNLDNKLEIIDIYLDHEEVMKNYDGLEVMKNHDGLYDKLMDLKNDPKTKLDIHDNDQVKINIHVPMNNKFHAKAYCIIEQSTV